MHVDETCLSQPMAQLLLIAPATIAAAAAVIIIIATTACVAATAGAAAAPRSRWALTAADTWWLDAVAGWQHLST